MKFDFDWPYDGFKNIDEKQIVKQIIVNKISSSKEKELLDLKKKLIDFEEIEFAGCAKNLVFGDGNIDSNIMFIGEAPGKEEDEVGKPFIGRSGQFLNRFLQDVGINRQNSYITNVFPWRPPGNRTPLASEIEIMKSIIKLHIEIIKPKIIVPIGSVALKSLDISDSITKAHGNIYETSLGKVFPVYHPAYALRVIIKRKELWLGLLKLKQLLKSI